MRGMEPRIAEALLGPAGWTATALVATGGAVVMLRHFVPRGLSRAAFVISSSAAAVLTLHEFESASSSAILSAAWSCAAPATSWAVVAATLRVARRRQGIGGTRPRGEALLALEGPAAMASLLLGATSGILLAVVLCMRAVYAAIEGMQGYPSPVPRGFEFDSTGVWALVCLNIAAWVGPRPSHGPAVFASRLWCAVMLALWIVLLGPVIGVLPSGRFERTALPLWALVTLAAVLASAGIAMGRAETAARWRAVTAGGRPTKSPVAAGLGTRMSFVLLGVAVVMLVAYQFAVPQQLEWGGYRAASALTVLASLASGAACLVACSHVWSPSLGDVGMALVSMGIAAVPLLAVPNSPEGLGMRYPWVFSAIIIGFGTAAAVCSWMGVFWQRQIAEGPPWTPAGRLVPLARRFAFVDAALALVVAAIMAAWPRMPWIAATDESMSRISAGLAANLFLLWALLGCARRQRRLTFVLLAGLALVSSVSFVALRLLPFTAWFG